MFDRLSDYPIHARLTDDEAWEIADSIQIMRSPDGCAPHLGTVTAQPHAAGWFIAAQARGDLSDAQSADLREFTRAATFVLLTEGPRPDVWARIDGACFAADQVEALKTRRDQVARNQLRATGQPVTVGRARNRAVIVAAT